MGRIGLRGCAMGLALVAAGGTARAESLLDAMASAYRDNPSLQAQRAELRAIDESYIQASSPYRLTSTATATADYSNREVVNIFGQRTTQRDEVGALGISAEQIISNGGRTAAQVSAAEADIFSSRERLREVEAAMLVDLIDAYVGTLRDEEIVAIRTRSVAVFQRQVDQAQARFKGGDLTRTDVGQAEAQLAVSRAEFEQANAQLQSSRGRFATVVGHNAGPLEPPPALIGLPASIDEAYATAEKNSPTYLQAVFNERAGRARVAAARAERMPIVALRGSYGYSGPLQPLRTRDYNRALIGTVVTTLPITAGGAIGSRIREREAIRQSLESDREATRRSVQLNVLQGWNQIVTASRQLTQAEAAVAAATTSSQGSRREYAEGYRSTFEVLNEEQRLLDAQLLAAQSRYARYLGQAALLASLGRLEVGQLAEGVTLYDPAANLRRIKRKNFWPLQPIAATIDKLSVMSGGMRPNPVPPASAAPAQRVGDVSAIAAASVATSIPVEAPLGGGSPGQPGSTSAEPAAVRP